MLEAPPRPGLLRGRRVAVELDGGRTRIRRPRRGRPSSKTGHFKSDPQWREPRELVIYVLNEDGKRDQQFRTILDGTFGSADDVVRLAAAYLRVLGVHEASHVVLLGDGADWIWKREDLLAQLAGFERSRLTCVVDWYHVVEKLHELAALPPESRFRDWHRKRWMNTAKKLLADGKIEGLLDHIADLARKHGANRKEVKRRSKYFRGHINRLRYDQARRHKLPIGSGAVESAIRRVINFRLKGNSKYWCEENAESMLLMRSYLKAGRLEDLLNWSRRENADWWSNSSAAVSPLGHNVSEFATDSNEVALAV